jgi:hypothetical protein
VIKEAPSANAYLVVRAVEGGTALIALSIFMALGTIREIRNHKRTKEKVQRTFQEINMGWKVFRTSKNAVL